MASFSRQLKRRKKNLLVKHFKNRMREVKKMVKCSKCEKVPVEGEKIDNWKIRVEADQQKISLICEECYIQESKDSNESENQDV